MNQYPILPGEESPARLLLRLPLSEKSMTCELSSDFTLPDYLPEIRKMLRVSVTVLPPESYIGGGNAEFSGKLLYHLLYTGSDGDLWATDLPADYNFSSPFEAPPSCDLSLGVDAYADSIPDMIVTRVTSPRKLSIRCRLHAKVRIYALHSLEEKLSGNPLGKIERLPGEADCAVIRRSEAQEIELSDEILPESRGNGRTALRVICSDGEAMISEAIPEKDSVNLRGDFYLKLMVTNEGGETAEGTPGEPPTVILRKIPFSTAVPLEGADRYCECRAFGVPSKLCTTVEDGRILCDVTLLLTAECQKNSRFAYTKDVFSTGSENESVYRDASFPFALRCLNGNFTLSDSCPLEKAGITPADTILDATGELTPDALSKTPGGRCLYTGEGHFHLLTRNKETGEYGIGEVVFPFRYEFEGGEDAPASVEASQADSDAYFAPLSIRVRSDGEKIGLDAEIAVSLRTCGERSEKLLSESDFRDPVEKKKGQLLLYYPEKDEMLWDAAKKYHVSTESLAEENGIDSDPKAPIGGIRFLLIS